jgi:hypothetical protein
VNGLTFMETVSATQVVMERMTVGPRDRFWPKVKPGERDTRGMSD